MATLKDVPMSALLEEIISRATNLALVGNFVVNGEEHEMGIIQGNKEKNYYNLALLQTEIIHGTEEETEDEEDDEEDEEDSK